MILKKFVFYTLTASCFLLLFSCKTTKNTTALKPQHTPKTSTNFYEIYSEKLNLKLKGTEDQKLIKAITEWLGTPYKYGGNTKQGTDCSGLVLSIYKEVYNIDLYRSSADQTKNVKPIDLKDIEAGDLLFFKISDNKVSHVGIYIAENKFIHSSTKRGVVINSLDEEYYKKHFFMAGRVINKPKNSQE